MADLSGILDPEARKFLPDRLALDDEKFLAVFEAHRYREEAARSKLTITKLCEEVGVCDRVFRKVRSGEGTLARHQVTAIAKLLGCTEGDIIRQRIPARNATNPERTQAELPTWPVPPTKVTL